MEQKLKAIFLKPPSIEILMDRLTKRSTEVEHMLKERIAKAKEELSFEDQYDVVLVNDVLERNLKECRSTGNKISWINESRINFLAPLTQSISGI